MKNFSKKIALFLALVMLAGSFTACVSAFSLFVLRSPIVAVWVIPIDLIITPILFGIFIADAPDDMEFSSLPEAELASLELAFTSIPETLHDSTIEKLATMSETKHTSLVSAYNSLPENEILSSVKRINSLPQTEIESLLWTFNTLSDVEFDSLICLQY